MFRQFLILISVLTSLSITGCDDSKMATVTGLVSVDGAPAKSGSISFVPVNGDAQVTGTSIGEDGKYKSDVPLVECKVEVRVPRKTGSRKLYDTPDSPVQDTFEEMLPAKFNEASELRFTAEKGQNEKNWDLATK